MLRLVLVVSCLSAALATDGWRACDGVPQPLRVEIEGCSKAPCVLPRGKDITMKSSYESADFAEKLETFVDFHELASGAKGNFPLPGPQKDTCKNLESSRCPVSPSEEVTYKLKMPVLTVYPKNLDLDLKVYVRDAKSQVQTCFQVQARTSN